MRSLFALLTLCCLSLTATGQQTPLFEEIRTVSSGAVPVESGAFTVTTAGSHDIVLTDLGAQLTPAAPVTAIYLAVMRGSTIVATISAAGTSQATLAAGSYVIRVAGEPGPNAGSGLFSVAVTAAGASQALFSFSGTLSSPAAIVPGNVRLYQGKFAIAAAGNYTAEIVDFAFPQALVNASMLITAPGAPSPAAVLTLPGAPPATSANATFTATPGEYAVFALGDSPSVTNAGLFAIRVHDAGSGALVFSQVLSVGRVASLGTTPNLAAGQYTVASADLAFPAALTQSGILLIAQSVEAVRGGGTSSTALTVATPGAYEIFTLGVPGTNPGSGTMALQIRNAGGASVYSSVRTVGGEVSSGTPVYAYPIDIVDAGTYAASVADLQFASALSSTNFAVTQGVAVVGRRDTTGSLDVTLAAGRAHLLVYATPLVGTGTLQQTAGLFAAQLALGSAAPLFQTTQGVGGVFNARSFQITATGDYRFTLDDLGFPANFAELAAAVTRGSQRLGLIYGEGSFDVLQATPGTYFVNFIARPGTTTRTGTYLLSAATKPPSPAVTLAANPVSPAPGATVVLTWSTQNATSCTASSSWTGSRPTSGTETTPAINTSSTYTLACTGPGGTTTQSLTVAPTAPNTSGGGGGRLDLWILAILGLALGKHRFMPAFGTRWS